MARVVRASVPMFLVGVLSACMARLGAADLPGAVVVKADADSLSVQLVGGGQQARLVEVPAWQSYEPGEVFPFVWQGRLQGQDIRIPRRDGKRDRLYSRFRLVQAGTGQPLGPPVWVTDLSALPARVCDMPWPKSIKGVTCPVYLGDLEALGVKYVDTNVVLGSLLDWRSRQPGATWTVDGQPVGINLGYVRGLDAQIKRMTDAGMNVTLILLNSVPAAPEPGNPLIHPKTDLAHAPNHLGAFNLTDERGLRHYRAAVEFLAERYSRPDREFGWVSGYIIGNELQAHWQWHNMGRVGLEDLVCDYARALRVSWLAVRRFHRNVRVYVSMEHHWASRIQNPMRSVRGDRFLDRLNAIICSEGNFPWHVAFHPYPANLFEPRFWADRDAVLGFDTPKITFKNLEVLPTFLAQERFLFGGEPRRIILSEQGFHCPDGPDGEEIQAAAYAAAWHKARHVPGIDAFMLHRHVDHPGEGGLRLGLWSCVREGPRRGAPDRKRRMWHVFQQADTDQWEQAFEFAKPLVGIESWEDMLPVQHVPRASGRYADPIPADALVLDLVDHMHEGEVRNCLDWRAAWFTAEDGRRYPTIFQHPPAEQRGTNGQATFRVSLPECADGERLVLRFGTVLTGKDTTNGVRFAILTAGKEIWNHTQRAGAAADHSVDLTSYAGVRRELTLSVDSLGDATFDWANWVRPVIVREN